MLSLTVKCPANNQVGSYYENENAKFWWDVPEYTGRDTEETRCIIVIVIIVIVIIVVVIIVVIVIVIIVYSI